jgi:hypothetical protein
MTTASDGLASCGHGLPLSDAARVLGVAPSTLRRWVREGAPVLRRGRRGRGHSLLLDPGAVQQWRGAGELQAFVATLASEIPHLLADAMADAHRQVEGADKRRAAGLMAASWYRCATAVLDRLREQQDDVPELTQIPEPIERLQKIARG